MLDGISGEVLREQLSSYDTMGEIGNTENRKPRYDLDERTLTFAKDVALFCKKLPRSVTNGEYVKQIVRSSGSIGANYIEANEAISKKDLILRLKISRKEIKETIYWLRLIDSTNADVLHADVRILLNEAQQLIRIFATIISKVST
jgi:four helix bundle protein